ncbi:hypothetical protein PCA31118_04672 [Pandoraea captiosa]|uniref:N-acetyltransferase domain-containing protein n=2 Tax=Pandoraea captiosa TaxID=2508302 RepID=A0A5E5ANF8_9BURK|nr:hypothetical protein PCA31118_04672 [Pandoraea captiosa]
MQISPYRASDMHELMLQPAQAAMRPLLLANGYPEALEPLESFTGRIDGRVVVCAGFFTLWEGNVRAWALIAGDIGPMGMLALHRAVRRAMISCAARRIEVEVDTNFPQAHRWVKMLGGFEWEGTMRKYSPEGRDTDRYAWVR